MGSLLKIDLSNLDNVILSHGHYDHSGGFEKFVQTTNKSFKLIVVNGFLNGYWHLTIKIEKSNI